MKIKHTYMFSTKRPEKLKSTRMIAMTEHVYYTEIVDTDWLYSIKALSIDFHAPKKFQKKLHRKYLSVKKVSQQIVNTGCVIKDDKEINLLQENKTAIILKYEVKLKKGEKQ